ncbi:hypothetical protein [Zhongshania sp.]|uniref:hypothetical protein n=1 Tax=Zhongshania sp. TaxID=1971902 RepID=UPI00356587A7
MPNGPCPAGDDTRCDLTGKPLAFAPLWKATFSMNYVHDLWSAPVNLLFGSDVLYKDDKLLQSDQDPIDVRNPELTFTIRGRQ